jgi:hypothetical protein
MEINKKKWSKTEEKRMEEITQEEWDKAYFLSCSTQTLHINPLLSFDWELFDTQ